MNYIIIENDTPENNSKIQKINHHVRNNKHIVIYFYKDGCPFCEKTTPEWDKLSNYLPTITNDLLFLRINKLLYEKLQSIGEKPMLYPNIRYVHGSHIDTFKKEGDERNSKNLASWILQQLSISKKQPQSKFLKKPKYKKSIKKIKRNNKFSKRRRQYYM
jgi:thiol-disulfide isomerase/thioredoxin